MRRRDFLGALGGAVAAVPWSHPAYAQQAMQVSGYLSGRTPGDSPHVLAAFRRGLAEAGFAEGQNVAIEFRWAEARYDRLPAMAAELTRLPVSVIALSGGNPAIDAAKAASNTIPVVFVTGSDPLREGWVTSLNRPGGNVTGTTFMAAILGTKQLELLRMMIPTDDSRCHFSSVEQPVLAGAARRVASCGADARLAIDRREHSHRR